MKFFDFGAFQKIEKMLSHDKILFLMLFGAFHDTSCNSWFSKKGHYKSLNGDEWKKYWTTRKWNLDRNRCNTLQLVRIQWVKRRRIFVKKYKILVQVWLTQDYVERSLLHSLNFWVFAVNSSILHLLVWSSILSMKPFVNWNRPGDI